jgi:hypothetical protein
LAGKRWAISASGEEERLGKVRVVEVRLARNGGSGGQAPLGNVEQEGGVEERCGPETH